MIVSRSFGWQGEERRGKAARACPVDMRERRTPRAWASGRRGQSRSDFESAKSSLPPILPVLSLVHQRGDAWANGKTSGLELCLNIEQKSKSLEYLGIHI